ncbi:MAG TPA: hypothetical protein VMY15_02535 [Candidatus Latescibacteria bacterium]|nr:hypothetical protein [Candidatus Latescibacterota bacterium]
MRIFIKLIFILVIIIIVVFNLAGAALAKRPGLTFYVPVDKDRNAILFSEKLRNSGGKIIAVDEPLKLDESLSLTGTLGDAIKEQALILDTSRGLVVVTGCAHPGIVGIIEKVREITGRPIEAVLGGFHLAQTDDAAVGRILHFEK